MQISVVYFKNVFSVQVQIVHSWNNDLYKNNINVSLQKSQSKDSFHLIKKPMRNIGFGRMEMTIKKIMFAYVYSDNN